MEIGKALISYDLKRRYNLTGKNSQKEKFDKHTQLVNVMFGEHLLFIHILV